MLLPDERPAHVLRLIAEGLTFEAIAEEVKVNRKTITRWRTSIVGFGAAADRVRELTKLGSKRARAEVREILAAWTPGGLVPEDGLDDVEDELEVEEPPFVPEVEQAEEAEVLGPDGQVILSRDVLPSRATYTKKRPPTPGEWVAMMAELAMDGRQPERLRLGAMASVTAALVGGPGARMHRQQSEGPSAAEVAAQEAAQREKGRDAGVPASVWQEARRNFLGPAPERHEDAGERGEQPAESSTA